MRVADNAALPALAENLRQAHRRHGVRAQHIEEKAPRPDARQLVGVAHEHKAAALRQRLQKRLDKRYVNHRALVENDCPAAERVALVLAECKLVPFGRPCRAEQAVDGIGLPAGELGHALGGAPGRRGEKAVELHIVIEAQYGLNDRRFAGAGAAGHGKQPPLTGEADGLLLLRGIAHAGFPLQFRDTLVHIFLRRDSVLRHGAERCGGIGLGLIQPPEIHRVHACHDLLHDLALVGENVEAFLGGLSLHADELRRGSNELFPREEAMAVIEIMYHFKNERRGDARRTVLLKAERERERVRLVKLPADAVGRDDVGVGFHEFERAVAIELIKAHGVFGLEAVRGKKLHQKAHAGLAAERFGNVPRAARTDALDLSELFGAVGQNFQRVRTETVHEHRRRCRADAAHRAGGEIFIDVLLPHRQRAHGRGRFELLAVARMALPRALYR